MQDTYLYLLVDICSFIVPFLFSFERKWIRFMDHWKSILLGLFTMSVFFIVWDMIFTHWGVWGFNDRYISGIKWIGLPIEEYLFFFMIGFCCLFVYESMNYIIPVRIPERYFKNLFIGIAALNILVAIWHYQQVYTFTALLLNGLFIVFLQIKAPWFRWHRFFIGYAISLIPFLIVNGILTGSITPEPVVWYDNGENLGIRLKTIPIEDSQYMMLMMTMSIAIYEWRKNRE